MLTLLLSFALLGQQHWLPPAPRAVPDSARVDPLQATQPVEAVEHTIGRIDASTGAKSVVWLLPTGIKLDTRKLTDGKSLYFTGPPGSYTFYEVALQSTGEPQSFERVINLKAAGPSPTPVPPPNPTPPNPNPNPQPTPVPPAPVPPTPVPPPGPGKYGVAGVAYAEGIKVPLPAREKSPALAGAFRVTQAQIRAGTIRTQKQLDDSLNEGYAYVVGTDRKAWDVWAKVVLAKVVSVVQATALLQRLTVAADCLGEVADGLAGVK